MKETKNIYLTFVLNEHFFAIPLKQVNKVVRAVAVTTVPDSNDKVFGVVDYEGKIIPVINLRACLNLPPKEITTEDRFMFLNTPQRLLAITVDRVDEIKELREEDLSSIELPEPAKIIKNQNSINMKRSRFYGDHAGIIVIYDVDELVNSEMEIQIEKILATHRNNKQEVN
jgi:purine-binding chemotaxis protein CheW